MARYGRRQLLIGKIRFESSGRAIFMNNKGSVDVTTLALDKLLPSLDPIEFIVGEFEIFAKAIPVPEYQRDKARQQILEMKKNSIAATAQTSTADEKN